ncbi:MAG: RNA 2'-phosphotransferase [Hyphomicrobiales bacterium]
MIEERQCKRIGKFISLILRHRPEVINITLDANGWINTNVLIQGINNKGYNIDKNVLDHIVATNSKKRFEYNEDESMIRASQGHSIQVDLELNEVTPPDVLYHGTVERFTDSISLNGLQKQNRQHVHLSRDIATAIDVGRRRGKPVILEINSKQMHLDGFKFFLSRNKVWLTDSVPVEYINYHNKESET